MPTSKRDISGPAPLLPPNAEGIVRLIAERVNAALAEAIVRSPEPAKSPIDS